MAAATSWPWRREMDDPSPWGKGEEHARWSQGEGGSEKILRGG